MDVLTKPILTTTFDRHSYHTTMDIDPSKEVLFFHGTKTIALKNLIESGFDMRFVKDDGKLLYGRGLYFAESCQKADQYADPFYERRNNNLMMFLVRVAPGKMEVWDDRRRLRPCGWQDSYVAGLDKKFREFIITDETQCFPEYVIIYKRVGGRNIV